MQFFQISEGIYIAAQLYEEDIQTICHAGIRTVICHRPDGEENTQPDFSPLAEKMRVHGIAHTYHQPVISATINEDDALILNHILHEAEFPVLMFCRTGTRCTYLWSVLQALRGVLVDELISTAACAGIDLQSVRSRLKQIEPI